MEPGARVAAGVGVGYLLGRTRRMRLAFMVAMAGATGAFQGPVGALLRKSVARIGSSPELSKLNQTGAQLVGAAKNAAITAATTRMDALSEKLEPYIEQHAESAKSTVDDALPEDGDQQPDEEQEQPRERQSSPAKRVTAHRRTATNRAPVRRGSK